jgi:hypothetical protein
MVTLKRHQKHSAMWDVYDECDRNVGTVWFGLGAYWYTVKNAPDYPVGKPAPDQTNQTVDKLSEYVATMYKEGL